jgi:hypothetical protein
LTGDLFFRPPATSIAAASFLGVALAKTEVRLPAERRRVGIPHPGNPALTNGFTFNQWVNWISQLRKQRTFFKFTLTLQFYTVKLDHDYKNSQSSIQKK